MILIEQNRIMAEVPVAQEVYRKTPKALDELHDHEESGDKEQNLSTFSPDCRITKAVIQVTGVAFQGKLKFLKGVKVTPSPVVYNVDGTAETPIDNKQAFIIDFTGIRSILKLKILSNKGNITLVLPWMGTEFSPKAVYPVTLSIGGGQFRPKAHVTGTDDVALTGVETPKLLVQIIASGNILNEADFLENCRITTATYPNNVKASINGRLPFWTFPGVLNKMVELTGLADDLNVLLKDTRVQTAVKLLLTTDTPGVLLVNFDPAKNLDVDKSAHARWGGQDTLDISLWASEEQTVTIPFPTTEKKSWLVNRVTLDLSGQFPIWQAYSGQENDTPGKLGMLIDAKFSVARRFVFNEAGDLYGFSLLLWTTGVKAEMRFEVVPEKNGQPDSDKPLATADISLSSESKSPVQNVKTPKWFDILFPSLVKIEPGKGMWIVAKAKTGSMEWVGIAETFSDNTITLFNNEGSQWQRYPFVEGKYPIAQIRILRQPFIMENRPILDVILTQNVKQSVDLPENTVRVDLSLQKDQSMEITPVNGTVSITLKIIAKTSGKLTIKGATAFYKEKDK